MVWCAGGWEWVVLLGERVAGWIGGCGGAGCCGGGDVGGRDAGRAPPVGGGGEVRR